MTTQRNGVALRLAVTLVTVLALAFAATAHAEGGATIASAPTVVYGQQEFGTLATPNPHCAYVSWWQLPVVTGDAIQIDWEVHNEGIHMHVFATGTNDFNFEARESLKFVPNSNLKTESTFTATQTGEMPMWFAIQEYNCPSVNVPGPYSFTATVTHALVVGLPPVATLARKGTLTVGVHNPEGGPISSPAVEIELQIKGRGSWQRIGTGTAASPNIAFKIPARYRHTRHLTLRALAHGTGYSPASSAHLKVGAL
jgi:hypothetical protein